MNIHEAVLQPIAEFVYCNRQAAAGRRRQAKDGNFQLNSAMGGLPQKLFYDGTKREIN